MSTTQGFLALGDWSQGHCLHRQGASHVSDGRHRPPFLSFEWGSPHPESWRSLQALPWINPSCSGSSSTKNGTRPPACSVPLTLRATKENGLWGTRHLRCLPKMQTQSLGERCGNGFAQNCSVGPLLSPVVTGGNDPDSKPASESGSASQRALPFVWPYSCKAGKYPGALPASLSLSQK